MTIEGIPDGWELVACRRAVTGDYFLNSRGLPERWILSVASGSVLAIVRKIEKPKRYRPFANAVEYFKNSLEGFAVDWKGNSLSPSFYAVISAGDSHVWVAFGASIERFSWKQALEQLEFRHRDSSTSPFGVEVQS